MPKSFRVYFCALNYSLYCSLQNFSQQCIRKTLHPLDSTGTSDSKMWVKTQRLDMDVHVLFIRIPAPFLDSKLHWCRQLELAYTEDLQS